MITEAVVSRPTFYEYFSDKDDCFLAALGEIQQQLVVGIETAVSSGAGSSRPRSKYQGAGKQPYLSLRSWSWLVNRLP